MCFLSNRTNFCRERQAFDRLLLASSGPKENVLQSNFIRPDDGPDSLGPDEARSNLSKACLSQQKLVLLLRKHI